MRIIFTLFLSILYINLKSQITFEKTYTFTSGYAIEEMPDGSFIGCGDSVQTGLVFKIDKYGNLISTFIPYLHDSTITVKDITRDPIAGGYAICGSAIDTTGNDSTGYFLLLDSMMNSTDSLFYSGGVNGPSAEIILWKRNNGFVLGLETFLGAGSYNFDLNVIGYPATNAWNVSNFSNISNNSLAIDSSGNILVASFRWVSASSASLRVYNDAGIPIGPFTITDTAYGGSLIFQSTTAPAPDGNFMFSAHVSPNGGSHSVEFLTKLDSGLNMMWSKYLEWGYSVNLMAITPTFDSCIVILLNTANGLAIHKLNSSGDSLWTQFHNRPTSGPGVRFQQCSDHGFVIVGQIADTIGNRAFVLKTDSLGRLLPDVSINILGALDFCQGDSRQLTAQAGLSYLWSTGETTQSITVHMAGSYYVTVEDSAGLQAISDSIQVIVHPLPSQPTITDSSGVLYSSFAISYLWFIDGLSINNSDSIAIVPTQTGFYSVQITDSEGCVAVSNPFYYDVTGISVLPFRRMINIFPNPTNGKFTIEFAGDYEGEKCVDVFDMLGNRLFHKIYLNEKLVPIDLKTTQGIYLLSIRGEAEFKQKIIIH